MVDAPSAMSAAEPAAEPENEAPAPGGKQHVGRETWVRGLDHVLPIDHTYENFCGPVEKLVEMLDSGEVDKDQVDVGGLTPLMKAAMRSHVDAMKVLIERGADISARCFVGETAVVKAKRAEQDKAVAILLEAGAEDLPVPEARKYFRIPGYTLEPCGTPDQQAEQRKAMEEYNKNADEEEARLGPPLPIVKNAAAMASVGA